MEEIIDDIQQKCKLKTTFSKLSFVFAIITLVLFILIYLQIPSEMILNYQFPTSFHILGYGLRLSSILGTIFLITAFRKKEKISLIKLISLVLNLTMFMIIIGNTIFAFIMDLRK